MQKKNCKKTIIKIAAAVALAAACFALLATVTLAYYKNEFHYEGGTLKTGTFEPGQIAADEAGSDAAPVSAPRRSVNKKDESGPATDGNSDETPTGPESAPVSEEQNEPESTSASEEQNEPESAPGSEEQNEPESAPGSEEQNEPESAPGSEEQNEPESTPASEEQNRPEGELMPGPEMEGQAESPTEPESEPEA